MNCAFILVPKLWFSNLNYFDIIRLFRIKQFLIQVKSISKMGSSNTLDTFSEDVALH